MSEPWPELGYDDWQPTLRTVHLWSQVIGKIALALAPVEPQWGGVALEVTPRGIATRPLPCAPGTATRSAATDRLVVELDVRDEELTVVSSGGGHAAFDLVDGLSVADFYAKTLAAVAAVGPTLTLNPLAQEMPDPPMLDTYTASSTFDGAAVRRFHDTLVLVANAFSAWRAGFRGRSTPVNFWWGTFDLALARFSGKAADPPEGADGIFRRAMDAEEVAVGFWPGDGRYPRPAFYSYGYPKPDGLESDAIRPAAATWNGELDEFVLDYDIVRVAADPAATIVEFAQSSYEAAATRLGWDVDALDYS